MKRQAAPAARRSRTPADDAASAEFMRNARALAIRKAARDAHRAECDVDAAECDVYHAHARAIAEAKWELNHPRNCS